MNKKRILIISYSFSSQTRNLLHGLIDGLEESGIEVFWEQLNTVSELRFPIGTIWATFVMMVQTFLRKRYPVQPVNPVCFEQWDLIILAGPTWSYNPSGPVLFLLDRDGKRLFGGKTVLPFISCRGYWRVHYYGLKSLLRKCGATVAAPVVFSHPTPEPWRTIGVFLKLAGKVPEAGNSWFHRFYPKYGHSRQQVEDSRKVGRELGRYIMAGNTLDRPLFQVPIRSEGDDAFDA
ncbi:MAG: NAD(P)H-dependent oxidoreductase [Desulfoarculaceae bacterium]|nr:NAD(P)H-dependent oxidoreductase [Desulfoarculaceae bacterium]